MRVLLDLAYRDPLLNLALDEAILREVAQGAVPPTLRVWRNGRCVIVGRGQRVEDEVDVEVCSQLRIPALKRPSGGGAVYHHPGNLNFSLYLPLVGPWTSVQESRDRITGLLAGAVARRWGLPAVAEGGAVFIRGLKVSGSAQLRRRALLHHGTLLCWRDEVPMGNLLLAHRPGYAPRGVPSRPAAVGDLTSLVARKVTIEEGIHTVLDTFQPLGGTELGAISLQEWALADAVVASGRKA